MRPIDADALTAKLEELVKRYTEQGRYSVAEDYDFVATVLLTAPTIDAVEVVRCKDCRFYEENAESRTRFCRRGLNYQYAVPDGFCSYGERKSE